MCVSIWLSNGRNRFAENYCYTVTLFAKHARPKPHRPTDKRHRHHRLIRHTNATRRHLRTTKQPAARLALAARKGLQLGACELPYTASHVARLCRRSYHQHRHRGRLWHGFAAVGEHIHWRVGVWTWQHAVASLSISFVLTLPLSVCVGGGVAWVSW